ncbi:GPI mannosyltransferase 3 [Schistocerca gregaria]|uniref:GPI mannosyltransferase 3 n=1 Tax=Schistocerca gregaria TaxID=7010 RepID=UPI00211EB6C0|nr:GPI mannosyltransferase 3 [Schistocerca gregaria]
MRLNHRIPVCLLLVLRLVSVFLVSTFYVPDEYWQSLEIAHRLAYGYGYTTWEWKVGIRSYVYPSLIALMYKIMNIIKIDTVENLILLPRIFQALLCVCADLMFLRWCRTCIGVTNEWALLNISIAWFHAYTATRTLTNTLETALTSMALCLYPWTTMRRGGVETTKYLWIVGFACLMRPTAFVIWLPFAIYHFLQASDWKVLSRVYIIRAAVFISFSTVVDSLCHGSVTCSPISFLYYNLVKNIASFYGTHGLLWYFTVGIPTVLGVHIFPFVLGCNEVITYKQDKARNVCLVLFFVILWTVLVYSMIPHKEFRFILPLLPMMLFIATFWLTVWGKRNSFGYRPIFMKVFLILGSVIPFLYCGIVHQRGTLDVMKILAEESAKNPGNTSIWFLMPCHSTPLYSHLHSPVDVFFLECDPLASQDVADVFFSSPLTWLHDNFPETGRGPSHIVIFNKLYKKIEGFLSLRHYKLFQQLFHSHFVEGNVGTHIMIFKRNE